MQIRKSVRLRKRVIGIIITIFLLSNVWANAEKCSARWFPVIQFPYISVAYPEWDTTYWAYTFRNYISPNKILKFSGSFPHARYMSFVLYNWETGNMLDQLLDADIVPKKGSLNPYKEDVTRAAFDSDGNPIARDYELYVVQQGSPFENDPKINTLVIPGDVENLAILMRVYLPDKGKRAPLGEAGLPVVTAYNDRFGTETQCPGLLPNASILPGMTPPAAPKLAQISDQVIWSFLPGQVGLYPNGDNPYLAAPMKRPPDTKVAVVRFKAPKFTKTTTGANMFSGEEEVRYWSVCLGGLANTSTSTCIADENMLIDDNGFVKIVVATADFVREKPVAGWNYIRWGAHARPVLLFRQIEAREDFEGSFKRVPNPGEGAVLENAEDILPYAAHTTLLEYGPQGIYCGKDDFVDFACGY